jgi:hypothetical protein
LSSLHAKIRCLLLFDNIQFSKQTRAIEAKPAVKSQSAPAPSDGKKKKVED